MSGFSGGRGGCNRAESLGWVKAHCPWAVTWSSTGEVSQIFSLGTAITFQTKDERLVRSSFHALSVLVSGMTSRPYSSNTPWLAMTKRESCARRELCRLNMCIWEPTSQARGGAKVTASLGWVGGEESFQKNATECEFAAFLPQT